MGSTYQRSLVKGIAWEFISFIITTIIVYLFHKNFLESLKFSFILTVIKAFLFFFHERIWKTIHWGKIPEPKKQ